MARSLLTAVAALALAAGVGCTAKEYPSGDASVAGAATGVAAVGYSLASGTRIGATIQDALSSRAGKPGDTLVAFVSVNIKDARGAVVIPAGSVVTLAIAPMAPGDEHQTEHLSLVVRSVTVNAHAYPMTGMLAPVPQHLAQSAGPNTPSAMVVSAGTPIVFTLAQSLDVSAR